MEKNKNFKNSVTLSGTLVSLNKEKLYKGKLENGADYISFKGIMACNGANVDFAVFASSKKFDGTESKNYTKILDWFHSAVPKTDNVENPTKATMIGSLGDNTWKVDNGIIREDASGTICNINFINPYDGEDRAFVSLDCYIDAIADEVINDEPTGRKNITIFSHDFSNKAIKIVDVKLPEDMIEGAKSAGWEPGVTAPINMDYATVVVEKKKETKGFGKQAPTPKTNETYTQLIVVGGDEAYDEDSVSSFKEEDVKELKALKRAKNAQALSRKGDGKPAKEPSEKSFGRTSSKKTEVVEEEYEEADSDPDVSVDPEGEFY